MKKMVLVFWGVLGFCVAAQAALSKESVAGFYDKQTVLIVCDGKEVKVEVTDEVHIKILRVATDAQIKYEVCSSKRNQSEYTKLIMTCDKISIK